MRTVRVEHRDGMVDVRHAETGELITCLKTRQEAADWLALQAYRYVEGTNGIWKQVDTE